MPAQSSLAAGVLQTAMRLSVSLGLAITTAIYGSALKKPQASNNKTFAFDSAFLCSVGFAFIGVICAGFLRIGKQGGGSEVEKAEVNNTDGPMKEISPRSAGQYSDASSQTGGHHP